MVVETHPRMADGTQYASTTHPPSVNAGSRKRLSLQWYPSGGDIKREIKTYRISGCSSEEGKNDKESLAEELIPKQNPNESMAPSIR